MIESHNIPGDLRTALKCQTDWTAFMSSVKIAASVVTTVSSRGFDFRKDHMMSPCKLFWFQITILLLHNIAEASVSNA